MSLFVFVLAPLFYSYGGEHVVLYHVGEKDPVASLLLKKYLADKGFTVSAFDGADTIEKHIELANKINRLKASLLLAVEFGFEDKEDITIAVTNTEKKTGQLFAVEDVPGTHAAHSKELAGLIAVAFNGKVLELPLFPLLGINMPGIFLGVECTKESAHETIGKVIGCLQKYFRKVQDNERKRKNK